MTTVFLDAHKVPLDPYTAASGMGLHTDQHGGAKVSHIGCWCCDRKLAQVVLRESTSI